MKHLFYFLVIGLFIFSCASSPKKIKTSTSITSEEVVRIANDSLEYEITIIDPGFSTYLLSIAKPANYYPQTYYELKNKFYVAQWNIRVSNPFSYNSSIYENHIDYDFNVDYGLDVNYKLYNYFKFVEYKYKQQF